MEGETASFPAEGIPLQVNEKEEEPATEENTNAESIGIDGSATDVGVTTNNLGSGSNDDEAVTDANYQAEQASEETKPIMTESEDTADILQSAVREDFSTKEETKDEKKEDEMEVEEDDEEQNEEDEPMDNNKVENEMEVEEDDEEQNEEDELMDNNKVENKEPASTNEENLVVSEQDQLIDNDKVESKESASTDEEKLVVSDEGADDMDIALTIPMPDFCTSLCGVDTTAEETSDENPAKAIEGVAEKSSEDETKDIATELANEAAMEDPESDPDSTRANLEEPLPLIRGPSCVEEERWEAPTEDLIAPLSDDFEDFPIPPPSHSGEMEGTIIHQGVEEIDEYVDEWALRPSNTIVRESDPDKLNGFFERLAKQVARNPRVYFWTSYIIVIILAIIGMLVGEFTVKADSVGWTTRGTTISDRQSQSILLRINNENIRKYGEEKWVELTTVIQPSWEYLLDATTQGRRLEKIEKHAQGDIENGRESDRKLPFLLTDEMQRKLQEDASIGTCDISIYTSDEFVTQRRLWPIWKAKDPLVSLLHPESLFELCEAEAETQRILREQNLCYGCDNGDCLPPYGLVLYATLTIGTGFFSTCEELKEAWIPIYPDVQEQWTTCVADIKNNFGIINSDLPESCPQFFTEVLVDGDFDLESFLTYSSTAFVTYADLPDELYEEREEYGRGEKFVQGVYDTQTETFNSLYQDEALAQDSLLGVFSAVVAIVAIIIHTKSPFITIAGLLQITLSFPLAYFIYKLIAQLDFFPFLNFIGIFVIFGLGADDIFVAVDKWKNARLEHPNGSVELIAALALPDAAGAMLLTTLTTAVAFFATAICEIAPIRMFAIFVGLLVIMDYILCILLVFPALCMYDNAIQRGEGKPSKFIIIEFPRLSWGKSETLEGKQKNDVKEKTSEGPSLIRRILYSYYDKLHAFRWYLFVISLSAFGVSAYYASTLDLPETLEVRLLPDTVEYEQNYVWRQDLLATEVDRALGSEGFVYWGLQAADTGDHNNPNSFTTLVQDESFDPTSEESQLFLLDFCDDVLEQEFASLPYDFYQCSMSKFDEWLGSDSKTEAEQIIYDEFCANATEIPLPPDSFHDCMGAWVDETSEDYALTRNGEVAIMYLRFRIRVGFYDTYRSLRDEFNLIESWMQEKWSVAPEGVNNGFFIGTDFWWYDTHRAILQTAYGSATIAISAAAVVILFSSRSLILTLFSTFTIGYVLASVTAIMVALGWTLGFLESICFSILIGISADFVTHFSHAYASPHGDVDRGTRTERALIHMGPSILAAAFTTGAAAIMMLFTVILFFKQFAYVLLFTILQATAGAMIVFCTLADCFGPSDPTHFVNQTLGCNKALPEPEPKLSKSFQSTDEDSSPTDEEPADLL